MTENFLVIVRNELRSPDADHFAVQQRVQIMVMQGISQSVWLTMTIFKPTSLARGLESMSGINLPMWFYDGHAEVLHFGKEDNLA